MKCTVCDGISLRFGKRWICLNLWKSVSGLWSLLSIQHRECVPSCWKIKPMHTKFKIMKFLSSCSFIFSGKGERTRVATKHEPGTGHGTETFREGHPWEAGHSYTT